MLRACDHDGGECGGGVGVCVVLRSQSYQAAHARPTTSSPGTPRVPGFTASHNTLQVRLFFLFPSALLVALASVCSLPWELMP
jgi:hypothetical protein